MRKTLAAALLAARLAAPHQALAQATPQMDVDVIRQDVITSDCGMIVPVLSMFFALLVAAAA